MTAQDLIDQIEQLIQDEFFLLEKSIQTNYLNRRKQILAGVRSMWSAASIDPVKSEVTGNVAYVSRTEANKYGRLTKLTEETRGVSKLGALSDISGLTFGGNAIYQTQYNGAAWVYNQGYGLPLTGGAKVKLIAEALYSDFYGEVFDAKLKKNWAAFSEDILSQVKRNLNQGKSYTRTALDIQKITSSAFNTSLRIARTEGHRIQSMAQEDSYALLDSVDAEWEKLWNSLIDQRTRSFTKGDKADHVQMDGRTADDQGIFHLLSGARGPEPGLTGNAADDINCRCFSSAIINGEKPTERRIRGEGIVPYETYTERLARGGKIPTAPQITRAKPAA